MKLRAHHLLCLRQFRGLGYSREFVQRFKEVKGRIEARPGLHIELIDRPDVICEACPHLVARECRRDPGAEAGAQARDQRVLEILKLNAGTSLPHTLIASLLKEQEQAIDVKQLCRSCQWFLVCSQTDRRAHTG